ncbi:hypothetical protein CYY_004296 [Polysphondylium violaceum]|uniref:PH domain-containing protein n=1 Tax=Polysphondylium violaceum TaxID=133409 RepID=A0A8J4UZC0_9MYCE|nr:hypothetical protein CYY_004296 [Polysphondylium violaceum]
MTTGTGSGSIENKNNGSPVVAAAAIGINGGVGGIVQQRVVKLIFPPTSSIMSKSILINDNQKVNEIIQFATQLAGLQPGYGLYLPKSSSSRGLWLDDDSLLTTYSLSNSDIIEIKKKPGFNKRKNTMMTLKGFKEGKVQKLSSITKIWIPRYLRLFSQRLVHSSNEYDTNTEFISFADIINVDRETSRKYAFIIQYYSTPLTNSLSVSPSPSPSPSITPQQQPTPSSSPSLQQQQQNRETKEYIFRCTNQNEAEDWVSSIRTMLKRARPDLFLPPLSILIGGSGGGASCVISPPITAALKPSFPPPKTTTTTTTSTSTPSTPTKPSHTWIEAIEHQQQQSAEKVVTTKPRSFSFSLSRDKKKRESPPTPSSATSSPSSLSQQDIPQNLEYELKKLRSDLDKECKNKQEIEAKYQKLKKKYTQVKRTRSKSMSAPVTPEIIKKDKFNISLPFIIGNSRLQNNSNNNGNNLSSSSGSVNNNHNNLNSSLSLSQSIQQNLSLVDTNELTENDASSDIFTSSVVGADALSNNYIEEINELKDQLAKVKQKLSTELVDERTQFDTTKKSLEKELFVIKKLGEKREREYVNENTKHNDQIEIISDMAIRIKKSLIELKDKLEMIQSSSNDEDVEEEDIEEEYDQDIDSHYPDNENNNSSSNNNDSIMNDLSQQNVSNIDDLEHDAEEEEESYILEQGDESMLSHETSITL